MNFLDGRDSDTYTVCRNTKYATADLTVSEDGLVLGQIAADSRVIPNEVLDELADYRMEMRRPAKLLYEYLAEGTDQRDALVREQTVRGTDEYSDVESLEARVFHNLISELYSSDDDRDRELFDRVPDRQYKSITQPQAGGGVCQAAESASQVFLGWRLIAALRLRQLKDTQIASSRKELIFSSGPR